MGSQGITPPVSHLEKLRRTYFYRPVYSPPTGLGIDYAYSGILALLQRISTYPTTGKSYRLAAVDNSHSIWIRRTYSDYGGASMAWGFAPGRGGNTFNDSSVCEIFVK